jgi:hypothetical protein
MKSGRLLRHPPLYPLSSQLVEAIAIDDSINERLDYVLGTLHVPASSNSGRDLVGQHLPDRHRKIP